MVVAWGVLLPLGILIARFFKVTSRQRWPAELDNKFWWYSHLTLQYSGVVIMSIAAGIATWHAGFSWSAMPLHAILGWILVALGWLQLIGGVLRGSKGGAQPSNDGSKLMIVRGDHYDMTARRVAFEYVHKTLGYVALALVPLVVALGLCAVNAPRWMYWLIGGGWALGILLFAWLQARGRCIDTYQAIWGPSTEHPGNRRRPIGLGVRRLGEFPESNRVDSGGGKAP